MAYIVTRHCVDCKYTDCVSVCPVDAFHEADRMLLINPDTCVDCDACVPACPVEAIYSEDNLPSDMNNYKEINAKADTFPGINEQKSPLGSARSLEEWKQKDGEWRDTEYP